MNIIRQLSKARRFYVLSVVIGAIVAVVAFPLVAGLMQKKAAVQTPLAPAAVNIVTTLTDSVSTAQNPGGTITYTATIQNTGTTGATGVVYNNQINAATTLVASSVNTSPVASDDAYNTAGNVTMVIPDGAGDLTANDTDADGNPRNAVAGTFATTQGGSITIAANGSFNYEPPRGYSGTDTYTYTINDGTSFSNNTATGLITFTVSTPIWFINPAAGGGTGTFASPYNSLATFSTANTGAGSNPADGDFIFLYSGTHTGGLTLRASQRVLGQSAPATTTILTFTGITTPSGTNQLPATGGAAATVANGGGSGLTLSTGNTINGFAFGNSSASAITGTSFGTATIDNISINTNAQALSLTTGTIAGTGFTSVTSTGGTNNISLTGIVGTLALGSGALSGASGTAFLISGGTAAITYSGTISKTSGGQIVNISTHATGNITLSGNLTCNTSCTGINASSNTSGTIDFSGATKTVNTGANAAVTLSSNTGATINFSGGGLDIDTTSGAGINATGGGTVNVITGANANTIDSGNGTALNVANTTIGASNLTFRSISSSGGSNNGIILNTTGSSGGLTVTGDGTNTSPGGNSSGGTIANKTGADNSATQGSGIYLNNTSNVVLRRMTINGTNQNFGLRGFTVNNFTMEYSTVAGTNGNNIAFNEGSVAFGENDVAVATTNGMTGSGTINGCVFSGGVEDTFRLTNISGTLDRLNITGSTFANTSTTAEDAFSVIAAATATVRVTVKSSAFTSARANLVEVLANTNAVLDFVFNDGGAGTQNTLTNSNTNILSNAGGFVLGGTNSTTVTYDIDRNTFRDAVGTAMAVDFGGTTASSSNGRIENNTIGVAATANSGSSFAGGIGWFADAGGGTHTTLISGNTVRQYNNHGILVQMGDEEGGGIFAGAVLNANVTVTNNTVNTPGNVNTNFNGFHLNHGITSSGTPPGDNFTSCLHISGNALTGSGAGASSPNNQEFRLRQRIATTVRLPGYGGANNNDGTVVSFIRGQNTVTAGNGAASNTVPTGGGFIGGAACTQPSIPSSSLPETRADFVDSLSFAGYKTAAEMLTTFEPFISAAARRETRADGESAAAENTVAANAESKGYWQSIAAFVAEVFDVFAKAVSPTAHAQNEKPTKVGTQNTNAPEAGETVSKTIGTLPAGKTVTIVYQATIANPACTTSFSTQGTVSGSNFPNVSTDDPDVAGTQATATSVNKATATNNLTIAASSTAGQTVTLTATVAAQGTDGGCTPSGTVQFKVNGNNLGSPVSISSGTATLMTAALPLGASTVTADYNGDASFNTVTSASQAHTVNKAATVFVDDSFAGSADAQDLGGGQIFNRNAFATINSGLSNVATTAGTVNVAAGTYNENVTLNQDATVNLSGNITQSGSLTISQGIWNSTSGTYSLSGNLTHNGGTFSGNGGTVAFNGGAAQTVGGTLATDFNNLTINNGSGITFNFNATIANLTLTAGNVSMGANTLTVTGTATRTSGYVIGKVRKNGLTGGGNFTFPIGTANGYSPVALSSVVGSGNFTANAVQTTMPGLAIPAKSINRYWNLQNGGITSAIVSFQFLAADIPGTVTGANLRILRDNGGAGAPFTFPNGGSDNVNETANPPTAATLSPVSTFSNWGIAEPGAPTASSVTIGGRVLTAEGRPVSKALMMMTDAQGIVRYALTNPFGYYRFDDVAAGSTIVLTAQHKRYQFEPHVLQVQEELNNFDLTASP